jgi:GNAT superfamily N-acetyltransferase
MERKRLEGYEGPRNPRGEEVMMAAELARSVFFPNSRSLEEAASSWPMAFHRGYIEGSFVILHEGRPVSMICRLERDVVIFGHRLRMGFIGNVCTHPDHRGKGLATTILEASMERFLSSGVDIVFISGARRLYYSTGANHVGGITRFRIPHNSLAISGRSSLGIRPAGDLDPPLLAELYRDEPVRFIRPLEDYELVLKHRHCSGKSCEFFIIEESGSPSGYLLVSGPLEDKGKRFRWVLEYCGEREIVLDAIRVLSSVLFPGMDFLLIDVAIGDPLMTMLLRLGISGEAFQLPGTVKLLDFPRTMAKLIPYFEERVGKERLGTVDPIAGSGRYVLCSENGILQIDGEENMLWTLFGAPPGREVGNVVVTGIMKDLIARCFPLPLPSLHVNMI